MVLICVYIAKMSLIEDINPKSYLICARSLADLIQMHQLGETKLHQISEVDVNFGLCFYLESHTEVVLFLKL